MATDREILKAQQAGVLGTAGASDPIGEVGKMHRFSLLITKASADAMASTTTSETYTGLYLPVKARLVACYLSVTATGITANATNYATITVSKRDSAGANKTTVVSFATDTVTTDDVTTGVGKSLTPTAANVICDAGSTFTYEIAKAASGVVVPPGTLTLIFEAV